MVFGQRLFRRQHAKSIPPSIRFLMVFHFEILSFPETQNLEEVQYQMIRYVNEKEDASQSIT